MDYLTLGVAVVALALALAARARAGLHAQAIRDAESDARRRVDNLATELGRELDVLRQLVARVAAGEPVDPAQILDGQLWRDVMPDEGARVVAGGDAFVLDVRTPQETAAGVIPGAKLIPIDQVPERMGELPRDASRMLVVCAGGGRSAAACELLSGEGFSGLLNLAGGMGAWTGPVERPS